MTPEQGEKIPLEKRGILVRASWQGRESVPATDETRQPGVDVVSYVLAVTQEVLSHLRAATPPKGVRKMRMVEALTADDEAQWITRREAARLAQVHYNTIKLWEGQGRLTPRRVTVENVEEVRINLEELQEVIAGRMRSEGTVQRITIPPDQLWEAYEAANRRIIELERQVAANMARMEIQAQELDRARGEWERLLNVILEDHRRQHGDDDAPGGVSHVVLP